MTFKYYEYNGEKIYIVILTLKDTLLWRKNLVKNNIRRNPKINLVYGIDGYNSNKIDRLLKNYCIEIQPDWSNTCNKTYGKLGCWLSNILIAKIAFDTRCKIILLEDDLYIPKNFNFKFNEYISIENKLVRLGSWGDGFVYNPNFSEGFIKLIYDIGLYGPNDIFMFNHLPNIKKNIISREKYGYQRLNGITRDERSSIKQRHQIILKKFQRKSHDKKKLLNKLITDINIIPNNLNKYARILAKNLDKNS